MPGAALVSVGLFCIVYGFSNAETHDRGCAQTWGFLVAGALLLNTLATSAATSYLVGRRPTPLVRAQAAKQSYSTAYRWSALFFAIGVVVTLVLYRPGAPWHEPVEASPSHRCDADSAASRATRPGGFPPEVSEDSLVPASVSRS